jgi:hypothetical protein
MLTIENKMVLMGKGKMARGWLCTEPALVPIFKGYFYKTIVFDHLALFSMLR